MCPADVIAAQSVNNACVSQGVDGDARMISLEIERRRMKCAPEVRPVGAAPIVSPTGFSGRPAAVGFRRA
jgi:hypothetical protein